VNWVLGTDPLGGKLTIVGDTGTWDARDVADQGMQAWADFMRRHGLM